MTTGLILAGHGSHISPHTAGLVWRHVDALRALGVADEVTAAFWKEQPSFSRALHALTADDVTVVPLFTAHGYFTRQVIPAEMGLAGALTERDGRRIRYTPPLTDHPYLGEMVDYRVDEAMQAWGLQPEQTAVAIIGHSTRRVPESRRATEAQAERLRARGVAAEVVAVYLDDTPEIAEAYTLTSAPVLVAVPYFLAAGSHTTIDVPEALGLSAGETRGTVAGREVIYTAPVGTEETLQTVILELAREAGAPLYEPTPGHAWRGFPAAGRDALVMVVEERESLIFGELRLTPERVERVGDWDARDALDTPAVLRARVREMPFRPLATSTDIPGGWHVPISTPEQLHAVVETVYPGAVADWVAQGYGAFSFTPLEDVAARQVGMFRDVGALDRAARGALVERVCGRCIRYPTWYTGGSPQGAVPCPEACNVWLSEAIGGE